MAVSSEQKKVINAAELPIGVHEPENPVNAFKYFQHCEVQQTWWERFRGIRTEYSVCWANVAMKGSIVVPEGLGNSESPSDDLRTNIMYVSDIVTPNGRPCVSAKSPYRGMPYKPNTEVVSQLNTDITERCTEGLHCCPTMESLGKEIGFKKYSVTTRDKHGKIIKITDHKLTFDH